MSNVKQNWDDWDKASENMGDSGDYFTIKEGANKFILLSHMAPLAQVWDVGLGKYRVAVEGDKNVSVKGVCWVMVRDDEGEMAIKQAKLPYKVVKAIRGYAEDPDWSFDLPFKHPFTLTAKGAGEKTVDYTLQVSPKEVEIPQAILDELKEKPTPEEIIEKIKGGVSQGKTDKGAEVQPPEYPEDELQPEDIPF